MESIVHCQPAYFDFGKITLSDSLTDHDKLVYESRDISCPLQDLVPFVQLKKREKHPWRIVTYREVAELLS